YYNFLNFDRFGLKDNLKRLVGRQHQIHGLSLKTDTTYHQLDIALQIGDKPKTSILIGAATHRTVIYINRCTSYRHTPRIDNLTFKPFLCKRTRINHYP